MVAEAKLNKWR